MVRIDTLKNLAFTVLLLPFLCVSVSAADGWEALQRGDFETAEKVWLPRAQRGEVEAQLFLGHLETMRSNYGEAAKWYLRAAVKGNGTAQTLLASQYLIGQGVKADPIRAFAWYEIAANQGHANAIRAREATASQMTAEQVEVASRMVKHWVSNGIPDELE